MIDRPRIPTRTLDDASWSRELIAMLERQDTLVDRLSLLAGRQAELVEHRRTDALLLLLGEREQIIEEFTVSQEVFSSYAEDIDARLPGLDETKRTRIQTLIASIGSRLESVMQRDAQDQQALETERSAVRRELEGLDRVRQARAAYRGAPNDTNRFADRKG